MTFNSILNALVTSVEENQQTIEQLLNWRGGETIITDDNDQPEPEVNETTGEWTLAQDTADTNGIYAGIYQFALNTACSILTIESVTGHTTPANTAYPPARYTDCDDVVLI